ncbi:MAG: regulatory protein RecX [Candidatus Tectomicrobia bacterium]|uniref:Regulatory protein RecX n=1 Tax=Tectimicrobiota bacterium TaxID=2528274 RepID=A0A932GRK2_UNCTE|nr:regulatory protein RecX [Candidatus Tectomicrobia bacterium]
MGLGEMVEEEESRWKAALETAVRYLARRARSRFEVEQRLHKARFEPSLMRRVSSYLEEAGYLDDEAFGRQWARDCLERKPMGARLLRQELIRRGLGEALATAIVRESMDENREHEMALEAARKKLKSSRAGSPEKVRERLFRFLIGRGFSYELAQHVIEEVQ